MFARVIGDDVSHPLCETDAAPIAQFADEFTLEAMDDVAQPAPVVGFVPFAISDQPDPETGPLDRFPCRGSGFTLVLGRLNSVPFDRSKGNVSHLLFPLQHSLGPVPRREV